MKQTKKGNEWHFGMKAHIGVDHETKLVHTVVATSANVHDSQILPDLLLGEELAVNPFLRTRVASVVKAAQKRDSGASPGVSTFAVIRAWKDGF